MEKSDILRHGSKAAPIRRNNKFVSSDYLSDEEDGYTFEDRTKITNDLSALYVKNNREIILTVQPTNGGFRLGINSNDSKSVFDGQRDLPITLVINKNKEQKAIKTKTTCGPPNKKGFDLGGDEINSWIIQNGFDKYVPYSPTKLSFILKRKNDENTLIFIKKV